MTVQFDPETSALSLDRVSFDALLALAAGSVPPERGIAQARAAGVIDGGTIHPSVRPAIETAADPVAVAHLDMRNEEGTTIAADVWVSIGGATYLVGPTGGQLEVVTTGPAFFPVSIARLVGLSARPRCTFAPWRMPVEMVDETLHDDEARRRDAVSTIAQSVDDAQARAFADVLVDGPWWYWTLDVRWPGTPDSEGARSMHVVDTRIGMAILILSEDRIAVEPTNPTDVFRLLTAILPRDEELAFG